jgi:hypothetical protein
MVCGAVLLIACANIANLLLARGTARRAHTAMRMALGATRKRLIRQQLAEAILMSLFGGLLGVAVAHLGARIMLTMAFPNAKAMPIGPTPSLPVLWFAFALSLLTGIVFGVVPAWFASHSDPAEALRGASRSTRDHSTLPQRLSKPAHASSTPCSIANRAEREPRDVWTAQRKQLERVDCHRRSGQSYPGHEEHFIVGSREHELLRDHGSAGFAWTKLHA